MFTRFLRSHTCMSSSARLLPFIPVAQYIPSDDEHWQNYLLVLDITDYLFAPEISEEEVAYLQVLIKEHHEAFGRLYPEASIIPKMHYVIHMPRLILE